MVQGSRMYMTTGKAIALTLWDFVSKVMSLLFNMLPRFAIEGEVSPGGGGIYASAPTGLLSALLLSEQPYPRRAWVETGEGHLSAGLICAWCISPRPPVSCSYKQKSSACSMKLPVRGGSPPLCIVAEPQMLCSLGRCGWPQSPPPLSVTLLSSSTLSCCTHPHRANQTVKTLAGVGQTLPPQEPRAPHPRAPRSVITDFIDAHEGALVFGDGYGNSIKGKLIKTEQAVAWGSKM